jgi:hypothetical protein
VAYKPLKSKYAIVFEERQIQSLNVILAVNYANGITNTRGNITNAGIFEQDGNTCRVTINDPYLDGVAWQSLNDINDLSGLGNKANLDGLAGYLKRKCNKGEDPAETGCFPYAVIDSEEVVERPFPVLIATMWYTIGGGENQIVESTYYFDIVNIAISHGTSGEPQVTLSGKNPFDIRFQQNLQPTFFDQGKTWVDEFNNKMFFKPGGFEVEDICANSAEEVKMDRVYRVNNLTPREILNKFMETKPGSQVVSLPTKEFANKIQICTKADSFCYKTGVFYLGKGLYESYKIDSKIPGNTLQRNLRIAPDNIEGPKDDVTTYTISIPDPKTTKEQIKDLSRDAISAFETQFVDVENYSTPVTIRGILEGADTLKIEKLENVSPYGDAKAAVAYYGGEVLNVDKENKSLKIKSKFFVQYCNKEDKCNRATLYQEYRKLKSISVKENEVLNLNKKIGEIESSEPQEKSKTRFYIVLTSQEEVTLVPSSIPGLISTSEGKTDIEKEDEAPTDGTNVGDKIGEIGSTGRSTGPHIHAEWEPTARKITEADVRRYVRIGGPVTRTSAYGNRVDPETERPAFHSGVDLAGAEGTPLFVQGGATIRDADRGVLDPDGYGYNVEIDTPEGVMRLSHLKAGSIPKEIKDVGEARGGYTEKTSSTSGAAKNGNQSGSADKDAINITTEFKGVPKALRILPGRTVLSFVTDYNRWVTSGKSSSVDPGVWIAEKYKSWYIGKVEYSWERGDLRLKVNGYLPWSYQKNLDGMNVQSWQEHKSYKGYKSYYDYIRSAGDLCYLYTDGKNSCTECTKTRDREEVNSDTRASAVNSSYAKGSFTYTGSNRDAVQSLINAADAAGVKSNIGQAAIVGNGQKESFPRLDPTAVGDTGTALGVFQWRADRQDNLRALGNSPESREQQMRWFVKELQDYPDLINYLNRDDITLDQAVREFGRVYLRPGTPDYPTRIQYAQNILNNLK